MDSKCVERDRLWFEYHASLKNALAIVNEMIRTSDPAHSDFAREANKTIAASRIAIHQHCVDHGCHPEWLEALEQTQKVLHR